MRCARASNRWPAPLRRLALASCLLVVMPLLASAQPREARCPARALPAYAHNDYANPAPLREALARGFRGVEVDLYPVGGRLRAGHNPREAAAGADFEAAYLAPLHAVATRCGGYLTADQTPFLLNVELKKRSPAAYDTLLALLARYPELVTPGAMGSAAPAALEVVLVGWVPRSVGAAVIPLGVQALVRAPGQWPAVAPGARVRLVSVDYGKSVARRWRPDRSLPVWLRHLAAVRAHYPEARVRVFNVPTDAAVSPPARCRWSRPDWNRTARAERRRVGEIHRGPLSH